MGDRGSHQTFGRVPQPCGQFPEPKNQGKCPPLLRLWRGQGHGLVFVFLPTRLRRSRVALRHVARHVGHAGFAHPTRPSAAQAPPLQGAQSVCGLDAQAPWCPGCTRDRASHPPGPVPPDPMPPTHRRPRPVDPSLPFCPPTAGAYRGGRGRPNLRAKGPPRGGPWRPGPCPACDGSLPEQHGTIVHGQEAAGALRVCGLAGLAAGLGMRAPARVCEGAPHTVRHGLVEAAEQRKACARSGLGEVPGQQVQRAAWEAGRRAVKDGQRRPSGVCRARRRGSGPPSPRSASGSWPSWAVRARRRWPSASCRRSGRGARRAASRWV